MTQNHQIRRSQTITPYGVGAILDISGQSLVAMDTSEWEGSVHYIPNTEKEAKLLGVENLRTAPQAPDDFYRSRQSGIGVRYDRFPKELFCSDKDCRRMIFWSQAMERQRDAGQDPLCHYCESSKMLVPMRFILICEDGHLGDVDWWWYLHKGTGNNCQTRTNKKIFFRSKTGSSGGLESLYLECGHCNKKKAFDELHRFGFKCSGKQPWFDEDHEAKVECEKVPHVAQRGASNVYFPEVASLLDIPKTSESSPHAEDLRRLEQDHRYKTLVEMLQESEVQEVVFDQLIRTIVNALGLGESFVREALGERLESSEREEISDYSMGDISRDEWKALSNVIAAPETNFNTPFVTEHADIRNIELGKTNQMLADELECLVKVKRLREIRALRGFRRYKGENLVPSNIQNPKKDMPAIEVYGEGIFFSLKEERLANWELLEEPKKRAALLESRRQSSFLDKAIPILSPRYILIHTLAHLLIRELMYGSGYESSSIRERLYVDTPKGPLPMSGLLLYTTEGDSAGTLGGLVRSGEPDHFLPVVMRALNRAQWCSLDPICKESEGREENKISLAACHACSLIAETSCSAVNSALDRNLLVHPDYGYFRDVISQTNVS